MASSKAHHATGFAAGVIAAAVVARIGGGHDGAFYIGVLMSFIAGVAGSTAPDWLEVAWWSRARRLWIAHRTLTHWGMAGSRYSPFRTVDSGIRFMRRPRSASHAAA